MFAKSSYISALGALILCTVSPIQAQGPEEARQEVEKALHLEADKERGKKVFEICAVCHLPEGWGTVNGLYPQIAGQHQSVIIKQLADIRALNRDNPTMRPFTSPQMMGGTQEIADVAAYIEALPMNPNNGVGPGRDLERGKQVYEANCAECHGDKGEGNAKEHAPMIKGQHFHYLVRQFDWIRTGKRRNADAKMVKQIRHFSMRDEMAVLDYVSRLRPSADKIAEPGWRNPDFPKFVRFPGAQMQTPMPPPMPPMPPRMERPQRPQ